MSSQIAAEGPGQVLPSGRAPADSRPRGSRRPRPVQQKSLAEEDPLQVEDRVSLSGQGAGEQTPRGAEEPGSGDARPPAPSGSGHFIDVTV